MVSDCHGGVAQLRLRFTPFEMRYHHEVDVIDLMNCAIIMILVIAKMSNVVFPSWIPS